jgi:hypothetical protein
MAFLPRRGRGTKRSLVEGYSPRAISCAKAEPLGEVIAPFERFSALKLPLHHALRAMNR